LVKIYTDDPNLPYKTTKLKALYTKSEIDGLFAKWGVHDVYWHWNPEANDVYVMFKIKEEVNGAQVDVSAKIEAFAVWNHKTRHETESINWNISLRTMYWFIKSHLEAAYLQQSSKTAAFLPYILNLEGDKKLSDLIIPKISRLQDTLALEEKQLQKVGQMTQKRVTIEQ
jgi:hypothetical protein